MSSSEDDNNDAVFQFLYGACQQMDEFKQLLKLHVISTTIANSNFPYDLSFLNKLRLDLIRAGVLGLYYELTKTDNELWATEPAAVDDEDVSRNPSPTFLRASMSFSSSDSSGDDDVTSVTPPAHNHDDVVSATTPLPTHDEDDMIIMPEFNMNAIAENRMEIHYVHNGKSAKCLDQFD